MNPKRSPSPSRWTPWLVAPVLAAAACPGWGQEQEEEWPRHFRLGIQTALNLRASFGMTGEFALSGSQPGPAGVAGANHFYDDGYVRVDNTGNAQGYTSYWGYQNASQYDPATQSLTFHSATAFSYSGGGVTVDDSPYVGMDLAYGGDLAFWKNVKIGWEFGFGLLPVDIRDSHDLPAQFSQVLHTYKTGGITLPTAPYQGGPEGYGPTLPDTATELPAQTVNGTVSGSRSLEAVLYQFRLGPSLYWPFHRRFALEAGAGFAMGLVSGDYRFDESVRFADGSQAANSGGFGATKLSYGGYVSATLLYHLFPHANLYLSAQYMSLGRVGFQSAGRTAQLDLANGVYLAGGLHWPF